MGFFDKLGGEFIDIIEWLDNSNDKMVHRFERYGNEIKNGAQLTVRETQVAIFVNEGKVADVFQPGRYVLETQNLPVLSTLQGWKYGFSSPFKAEVYFVNTKRFTDFKWGTKNPIMLRDLEFGPIRLRAFGSYCLKVSDASVFLKEIVGTDGDFNSDEISSQLRNIVVSRFSDALGESKIPALDLAANYDELGEFITNKISPEFQEYGLELSKLLVENISLPEVVEQALDKRSSMGVLGDLNKYTQFQTANSMEAAANNPGGMAAGGMGMGMGFAMANQMGQSINNQQILTPQAPTQQAVTPPPLTSAVSFFIAVNGAQTGPFDINILSQKVTSGELKRETLVWKEGMAAWTVASEVAELKSLLGKVPPPIPTF
ncbi:SPFH domain-containing protein [Psychromonas sp.]|nr:SPFH domain-containing protein [Psychromonas sp.]